MMENASYSEKKQLIQLPHQLCMLPAAMKLFSPAYNFTFLCYTKGQTIGFGCHAKAPVLLPRQLGYAAYGGKNIDRIIVLIDS